MMKIVFVLGVLLGASYARTGFGPGEQDWDYVEVRPGAFQFWWLYETTASVANITEKPLIIWLQGGPGAASTSFGNFAEIGPLDIDLNVRNNSWVNEANILFIDNPVGTGYSYVEKPELLTTTNKQIADDLIACLHGFYQRQPQFRNAPLYVAAESYGGKMASEFAIEVQKLTGSKAINLKGVTLIDSWISPIESVLNWAPFLYNVGAVDHEGYLEIAKGADDTKEALDNGEFKKATELWGNTEYIIMRVAKNVDFYNILDKVEANYAKGRSLAKPGVDGIDDVKLNKLMNGPVKEALKLNVTFGAQSGAVFEYQSGDFMKPVTHLVERILNETDLKVQVVTGQLDLIVDTPGTIQWVDKLSWKDGATWKKVPRNALAVNGINEGYQKKLGKLSVYWVNRAGHMVPLDNPDASLAILDDLMGVKPT